MAKQLQLRKGTATEHNTFTGANGEVTVDTTNKTLRVHDGSTVGGTMLATSTGGLVPAAQLPAATTSTQGAVILNNTLTSTSTTQALTAAQGKVLKDTLDNTAASSLGVGQTWQDVTSSRSAGVTYINNTQKPIMVIVTRSTVTNFTAYFTVNGIDLIWGHAGEQTGIADGFSIIIPVGTTYKCNIFSTWAELR